MSLTTNLPTPEEIGRRIEACRDELAALKRLRRAAQAAAQAEEARHRREGERREAPRA